MFITKRGGSLRRDMSSIYFIVCHLLQSHIFFGVGYKFGQGHIASYQFTRCSNSHLTCDIRSLDRSFSKFSTQMSIGNNRRRIVGSKSLRLDGSAFTTKSVPYKGSACYNAATSFVYMKNLCNTETPQSVETKAEGQSSCKNMCGYSPQYGDPFPRCACDEKCATFGDCCQDFKQFCLDLSSKGRLRYGHLGKDLGFCSGQNLKTIATCEAMGSVMNFDDNEDISTTILPSVSTGSFSTVTSFNQKLVRAIVDRRWGISLADIVNLVTHRVADFYQGFIFESLDAFRHCRVQTSVSHIIPKLYKLQCLPFDKPIYHMNVLDMLPKCVLSEALDVYTNLHRGCENDKTISCDCLDGGSYQDTLHNMCSEQLNTSSLEKGRQPVHLECTRIDVLHGQSYYRTLARTLASSHTDLNWTMLRLETVSAISAQGGEGPTPRDEWNTNQSSLDENGDIAFFSSSVGVNENVMKLPTLLTEDHHEYVYTFSEILERQFRCKNIKSSFNCTIEVCAPGAVLFQHGDSTRQFEGQRCGYPNQATVEIDRNRHSGKSPLCLCMLVVFSLSELALWDVKMVSTFSTGCLFNLTVLQYDPQPLTLDYTFGDETNILRKRTASAKTPTVQPSIWDRLQQVLYTKTEFCSSDGPTMLTVCLKDINASGQICSRILAGSLQGLHMALDDPLSTPYNRTLQRASSNQLLHPLCFWFPVLVIYLEIREYK